MPPSPPRARIDPRIRRRLDLRGLLQRLDLLRRLPQRLVLHQHRLREGVGGARRSTHFRLDDALGLRITLRLRHGADTPEQLLDHRSFIRRHLRAPLAITKQMWGSRGAPQEHRVGTRRTCDRAPSGLAPRRPSRCSVKRPIRPAASRLVQPAQGRPAPQAHASRERTPSPECYSQPTLASGWAVPWFSPRCPQSLPGFGTAPLLSLFIMAPPLLTAPVASFWITAGLLLSLPVEPVPPCWFAAKE